MAGFHAAARGRAARRPPAEGHRKQAQSDENGEEHGRAASPGRGPGPCLYRPAAAVTVVTLRPADPQGGPDPETLLGNPPVPPQRSYVVKELIKWGIAASSLVDARRSHRRRTQVVMINCRRVARAARLGANRAVSGTWRSGTVEPIERYVASHLGRGLTRGMDRRHGRTATSCAPRRPPSAVLMVLVIVGELYPIRLPLGDDAGGGHDLPRIRIRDMFLAGPALAIIAQSAAALASDVRSGKPWWKAIFNVAQYALSVAGASDRSSSPSRPDLPSLARPASRPNTSGRPTSSRRSRPACRVVHPEQRVRHRRDRDRASIPVVRELRNNIGFHTATTMVLIAQGPLIALAASRSLIWVLLFVPGIFAVYRTASISVDEGAAGHPRLADRAAQPPALPGAAPARVIADSEGTTRLVVMLDRPRRLQGSERHARPPHRRLAAVPGRSAAERRSR